MTGQVPPPLASGTVGLNIKHDEVESEQPADALGLPTGYTKGPNFGKPQSITNYPGAQAGLGGEITRGRTFRMSVGIRF